LDFTNLANTSKQDLFLSHPITECSCSLSAKRQRAAVNESLVEKQNSRKHQPLDDLEICPQWMETHDVSSSYNGLTEESNGSASETEEVMDDVESPDTALQEGEAPIGAQVYKVEKEDNQGEADEDIDAND
jgi:hypothetical protein